MCWLIVGFQNGATTNHEWNTNQFTSLKYFFVLFFLDFYWFAGLYNEFEYSPYIERHLTVGCGSVCVGCFDWAKRQTSKPHGASLLIWKQRESQREKRILEFRVVLEQATGYCIAYIRFRLVSIGRISHLFFGGYCKKREIYCILRIHFQLTWTEWRHHG